MAIDASIYNNLGAGVTPLMNPLDIQARKIAIRNALAGGQMQDLQLQQAQQALTNQKSVDNFFSNRGAIASAPPTAAPAPAPAAGGALPFDPVTGMNPDPTGGAPAAPAPTPAAATPAAAAPAAAAPQRPKMPSLDDLLNAGVSYSAALPVYQSLQKVDETTATIDKARADASRANSETAAAMQEYMSEAASAAVKSGMNPAVVSGLLDHFGSIAPEYQAQANLVRAKLASMPPGDQLAYMTAIANQSPKRTEADAKATEAQTAADRFNLQKPGLTPNANGLTPEQQSNADLRAKEIAKLNSPAELALIASKPGPDQSAAKAALDLLKANNIAERQASQPVINLTPGAQTMLADNYAQTGTMPTIPRGAGGSIVAGVLNQAAANHPGANLGANRATFKADSASLMALQKQRDVVGAFEQTATKNLDMFLDLAKKLPDTGVPFLNLPLRMVNERLAGSANIAAVNAARNVANNEIAKVTTSPGLAGALSDSARHEVEAYNPKDATFAQTLAVARVLRQDMANRPAALDAAIKEVKGRLGSTAPASGDGLQHKSTDELLQMLTNPKGK